MENESNESNNLASHFEYLSIEVEGKDCPSIYKIPDDIKKVHPKAFKPQRVSLGPYHHGEVHLFPMEKEKLTAFKIFQSRCGLSVGVIKNRVRGMLKHLQGSYNELGDEWNEEPEKFLEIMILDGCFVLEILLEDKDERKFVSANVLRDMLLLENQLPMILLDELYSMVPDQNKDKLVTHARKVVSLVWQFDNKHPEVRAELLVEEHLHLLDMYTAELLSEKGNGWKRLQRSLVGPGHKFQPAKRLREAGIKFKKGRTDNLTDVSFDKKQGVLSLPLMEMNAHREAALLNAMAFEKLGKVDNKVASFIVLMSYLIQTDAEQSFCQLAKGEILDMLTQKHYNEVFNMVDEHCNERWNIWWTTLTLRSTKFQDPWTIISVVAALLGFALVILQTTYQIYAHYSSHPS